MYGAVVLAHSIVRWLVIVAGLLATLHSWRAASYRGAAKGPIAGLVFTALFDLQLVLGLFLYLALSPITTTAMHRFGSAMSNDVVRFYLVEHPFGMVVALVLAHIARVRSRRAVEHQQDRRRAAIYFTLAFAIVLITTPWPFMPYGRPLL